MIDLETVARGVRHPERLVARARRYVGRFQNRLAGCDVMAEDWDNLLILDACRYDLFERVCSLPGRLDSRRSRGSATREFVRNNFAGRHFSDTVYVTGNPFVSADAGDAFHETLDVWRTDWAEDFGTVRPIEMREAVRRANEAYPHKRLVGHLMQPHHPFIGSRGRTLLDDPAGNEIARRRVLDRGGDSTGTDEANGAGRTDDDRGRRVWNQLEAGRLSLDDVRAAYEENLELVLPTVEALVEALPGKTVVTSDHGNLLCEPAYGLLATGSRRVAHPKYATASALVRVPWLVCPVDGRKRVTSEPPRGSDGGDVTDDGEPPDGDEPPGGDGTTEDTLIDDRLEALGYR